MTAVRKKGKIYWSVRALAWNCQFLKAIVNRWILDESKQPREVWEPSSLSQGTKHHRQLRLPLTSEVQSHLKSLRDYHRTMERVRRRQHHYWHGKCEPLRINTADITLHCSKLRFFSLIVLSLLSGKYTCLVSFFPPPTLTTNHHNSGIRNRATH